MMPGSLIAVTPLAHRYLTSWRRPVAIRSGDIITGARWGNSRFIPASHQCPASRSSISLAGPWPAIAAAVSPSASIAALLRKNSWQDRCHTTIGRMALTSSSTERSSAPCQSLW